jgi:hypothetical protein
MGQLCLPAVALLEQALQDTNELKWGFMQL